MPKPSHSKPAAQGINDEKNPAARHVDDVKAGTKQANPAGSNNLQEEEHNPLPANIHVLNSQRFAVQVYASQDATAAQTRAEQLSKLGYDAREVEAQVAGQGLWHRVIFGDWSSRAQAQIAGERYSKDRKAATICASDHNKGPAFIIRDDVLPMEINPRLAQSLQKNSLGQSAQVALVQSNNESEPVWVLLVVKGDNQIRLLDVTGGLHASWPLPQWKNCPICQQAFAGQKPTGVQLQFADSLAPGQADLVLSEFQFPQGRVAQWRQIQQHGQSRASLTYPVLFESAGSVVNTRYKLLEADGDDGFELLLMQWKGTEHEGDLCEVQFSIKIYDPGPQGLQVMNQDYYKNLADNNIGAAQRSFDHGLDVMSKQKTSAQGWLALAGFGRSTASLTDLKRKQKLLESLKKSGSSDAPLYQALVLSEWINVHPSLRIALADEVINSLDRLLADKRFSVPTRSCDEKPLAKKGTWSAQQLQKWQSASSWSHDLRRLPVEFFTTMAKAYDVNTPAGKRLEQLAQRLRPASAIYKKIRSRLDQAWSTASTK